MLARRYRWVSGWCFVGFEALGGAAGFVEAEDVRIQETEFVAAEAGVQILMAGWPEGRHAPARRSPDRISSPRIPATRAMTRSPTRSPTVSLYHLKFAISIRPTAHHRKRCSNPRNHSSRCMNHGKRRRFCFRIAHRCSPETLDASLIFHRCGRHNHDPTAASACGDGLKIVWTTEVASTACASGWNRKGATRGTVFAIYCKGEADARHPGPAGLGNGVSRNCE
jgi:hypothetical protein